MGKNETNYNTEQKRCSVVICDRSLRIFTPNAKTFRFVYDK